MSDPFSAAAAAVGADLLTGWMNNEAAEDRQNAAQNFSANQFATRYQTTVKDMQAAGLNPMLAYSQGGGLPPSSSAASSAGTPSLGRSITAAYNLDVERNQIRSDTDLKIAQTHATESMARLTDAQRDVALKTVDKVVEETANIKKDTERLDKLVLVLEEQRQNLIKEGYNLTEQGNVLRATVDKLKAEVPYLNSAMFRNTAQAALANAETRLKGFDINAAERSDNLGRTARQYQFLLEIAKLILRR
jgi:hypothetical protein